MPGSVQNATPLTVLPESLSRAFVHEREYPVLDNEYRNGESQRKAQANNSRKRWHLAKRLARAQLETLRDFFDARKGPTEPFYFYDPYETSPKFSHDPTGQATAGRYTVRFAGTWEQSASLARTDLMLELIELA
jgi:phage-related protein